jgi:phage shock protein PspC (stress-responsive transcriptional regulator)
METETETRASGSPTTWKRAKKGRMLAGVAAGIANQLGVPSWVIRVAFVVLTFWGGAGLLLYTAGWLLMPGEGEPEPIARRWANHLHGSQSWVGLLLVIIAASILIGVFPFFDGGLVVATALLVFGILLYRGDIPGMAWPGKSKDGEKTDDQQSKDSKSAMNSTTNTDTAVRTETVVRKPSAPPSPLGQITLGLAIVGCGILAIVDRLSPMLDAGPRHYLALIITVVGMGLLIGAFFGRARWLIVLGIFLIPATFGTAVVELADGRIGGWVDELARPTSFDSVAASYDKGAGQLVIDLTDLPWNGETVNFTADVGVGELVLVIPQGVALDAKADVGIGEVASPAGTQGGLGVEENITLPGNRGRVIAILDVGVGAIRIDSNAQLFEPGPAIGPITGSNGDLLIDLADQASLESLYATSAGDIVLDLGGLVLESDTAVELVTDTGDIEVILPSDASYQIEAVTDSGAIDLFGQNNVANGGLIRTDSISGENYVITLLISSVEGDITLSQGERS